MPDSAEPYLLLGGLLVVVAVLRGLAALFGWRRLSARQQAYHDYMRSDVWRRLRREALDRDGRRCRLCNANEALQVHHRYYPEVLGTETVDALTTLCGACHEAVAHRDRHLLGWRSFLNPFR